MGQSGDKNYGIQINNGNLHATNVAAGENATAFSGNFPQVLSSVSDLKSLIAEVELPRSEQTVAEAALAEIETEAQKPSPEKGKIQKALERLSQLGSTSTALFPLIDRITPLLQRIGQIFSV